MMYFECIECGRKYQYDCGTCIEDGCGGVLSKVEFGDEEWHNQKQEMS